MEKPVSDEHLSHAEISQLNSQLSSFTSLTVSSDQLLLVDWKHTNLGSSLQLQSGTEVWMQHKNALQTAHQELTHILQLCSAVSDADGVFAGVTACGNIMGFFENKGRRRRGGGYEAIPGSNKDTALINCFLL